MSNGETASEDRTILAAVEALEEAASSAGAPGGALQPQSAETETLARLYTEVLGLIPFELAPLAPSPDSKARLLAQLQGQAARPAAEPAPAPSPSRASREMPVPRLAPPGRPAVAMARRPSRWPLAIAAILAMAAVGLSGWSGWLYQQLGRERATVASLRRDVASEQARLAAALAQARDLRTASGQTQADRQELQEKLDLTSHAAMVAAMRPMGRPPLQPAAHGMLFVAADHQHWYLSLAGLQPATPGQSYKLWFIAGRNLVDGGSFVTRPGQPVELTSKQMPTGTTGALVTLERDPNVSKPSGPQVLRSQTPYQTG